MFLMMPETMVILILRQNGVKVSGMTSSLAPWHRLDVKWVSPSCQASSKTYFLALIINFVICHIDVIICQYLSTTVTCQPRHQILNITSTLIQNPNPNFSAVHNRL